jgi:hypothetical protein
MMFICIYLEMRLRTMFWVAAAPGWESSGWAAGRIGERTRVRDPESEATSRHDSLTTWTASARKHHSVVALFLAHSNLSHSTTSPHSIYHSQT